MQNKRRLPILALTLVAFASAAPQEGAPPARLGNDFVYRVLAKQTDENVAVMPGGPLVALADLGSAGYELPESAQKRIGGSTEAAEKLARSLGLAERNLSRAFPLNHARSAWLSEAPAVQVETVQVRPAAKSNDEASGWLDRASRTMRIAVKPYDSMEAPKKPAGLATVSTLNAENMDRLTPVPPPARIRFNDKPVETLFGTALRYSEDDLAQTALIPVAGKAPYMLAVLLPKAGRKLEEVMPEVGARLELVTAAEEIPAMVQMPRIVQTTEADVADALGLGQSSVAVPTRTGVVIGAPYVEPKGSKRPGGGFGGSGISMRMWHPDLPMMGSLGGRGSSGGKSSVPKPLPILIADRPFVYAIMDVKTRTILLAGVVRQVEPAK